MPWTRGGEEETKPYLCLFSWLPVAITLPPPTPPGIQQVNQTLLIINVVPGRRAQLWGERFESREKIKVIEFFMTSGGAWSMMAMKYAGLCRWGREKCRKVNYRNQLFINVVTESQSMMKSFLSGSVNKLSGRWDAIAVASASGSK